MKMRKMVGRTIMRAMAQGGIGMVAEKMWCGYFLRIVDVCNLAGRFQWFEGKIELFMDKETTIRKICHIFMIVIVR